MIAAVPNVSAMDTLVAKSDNRNCFKEAIPLPIFRLFGVCSLMFIMIQLVLFFSYKNLQPSVQRLATKTAVDDLTLRIDEDVVGDDVNLIDGGCSSS